MIQRLRSSLLLAVLVLPGLRPARAQEIDPQYSADHEGDQDESEGLILEAEKDVPLLAPAPGHSEAHPYDALVRRGLGAGNWGVEFILIAPGGGRQVLSRMNEAAPLMPASTMKLFTSWFGYTQDKLDPRPFPVPYRSYEAYAATMLKDSVNAMAIQVLSVYGGGRRGPSVMEKFYADQGLPVSSFRVADGAGLSVKNRATADLEISLLERIRGSGDYLDYRGLLAEPGETGTLKNRLPGLRGSLYAKTGTLTRTRVAALAGFVDLGDRGTIVFSIIGNNSRLSVDVQRARIDGVVQALRDAATAPASAPADVFFGAARVRAFAAALPTSLLLP
jgi:D-alanyl-D-alanine carboxypeptidase/D-alanyl-D-alanine-endopeptidase (penicillin-binding protein 4)